MDMTVRRAGSGEFLILPEALPVLFDLRGEPIDMLIYSPNIFLQGIAARLQIFLRYFIFQGALCRVGDGFYTVANYLTTFFRTSICSVIARRRRQANKRVPKETGFNVCQFPFHFFSVSDKLCSFLPPLIETRLPCPILAMELFASSRCHYLRINSHPMSS